MSPPDDAKRRGRRQFLMVASLFVVPVVTAIVLYRSVDWRPVVNAQGTLIDPPRTLAVTGAALLDGSIAPADAFEGRWSVVRPVAGDCGTRERALLEELGRVRLALDKDADRVRRIVVHDGGCAVADFGSSEPDLRVYIGDGRFSRAVSAFGRRRGRHLYSGPAWQLDDELPCARFGARPAQGSRTIAAPVQHRLGDAHA